MHINLTTFIYFELQEDMNEKIFEIQTFMLKSLTPERYFELYIQNSYYLDFTDVNIFKLISKM